MFRFTPTKTSEVGGFEITIDIEQSLSQQTLDSSSEGSKSPRERIHLRPCRKQISYIEPDTSNESGGNGDSSETGGNGDESSGSTSKNEEQVCYWYEFGFLSLSRLMKVTYHSLHPKVKGLILNTVFISSSS